MENGIYKAISAVLSDVGAVGKDGQNTFDKYKYRSIDAVMNAMHPAMAKHGVFVTPEVLEQSREERPSKNGGVLIYSITKVKYTFYTADGSSVTATVIGEGMDKGDKSMNKAMSAAFKYALFQVFCIPTEEFVDSETGSPEPKPRNQIDEDAKFAAQAFATINKAYKSPEKLKNIAEHYGKEKVTDLSVDDLRDFMSSLEGKINSKKEEKEDE